MQQITHMDFDKKGERLLVVGYLTDREQYVGVYDKECKSGSEVVLLRDDHVQRAGFVGSDKALVLSETVSLYDVNEPRALFSENMLALDFSIQPMGDHVALGLVDSWSLLDLNAGKTLTTAKTSQLSAI